jgi:hypothetical protein
MGTGTSTGKDVVKDVGAAVDDADGNTGDDAEAMQARALVWAGMGAVAATVAV